MNRRAILVTFTIAAVVACLEFAGCTKSLGVHGADSEMLPPSEVVDFNLLYGQNCAGCHGADGKGGAAIALANPVFLASLKRITRAAGAAGRSRVR